MTETLKVADKSLLAKLLATENITMRHNPSVPTAYFDIKTRELVLPVWHGVSNDLYDMLVVHEVGHALDTDLTKWMEAIDTLSKKFYGNTVSDKQKSAVRNFLNVVEDARIDKRQKRRYPGSRKNYVAGYKELHDRDFFGIQTTNVNDMIFIDRANIYFKGGVGMNIKFTDLEKKFLARIENAETFEEVVSITSDIYDYALTVEKNQRSQAQSDIDGEASDEETDGFEFEYSEDSEEGEDTDKETVKGTFKSKSDDADKDGEPGDKENTKQGAGDIDTPRVATEEKAQANAKSIVKSENVNYIYIDLPTKVNYNLIVDDYPVIHKQIKKVFSVAENGNYTAEKLASQLKTFNEWKAAERDTISFMVKEFEMKKSAETHARTKIAKTGVIDTNKLVSYKFNDDIFRRVTNVSSGKNHGFVIFLDWSGSMSSNLEATLQQLFSLVLFCRRINVPFEVYTFRSFSHGDQPLGLKQQIENVDRNKPHLEFDRFKLRNLLSSRMNVGVLNDMMNYLYLLSRFSSRYDSLGGTPLNQAVFVADKLVNDFQKKNRVQIVNTIIITDGESDNTRIFSGHSQKYGVVNKYFLTDPVTKNTYDLGERPNYNMTKSLIQVLKARTNCNLIGIFLSTVSYSHLVSSGYVVNPNETSKNSWKDKNFVATPAYGYDEYYIIKPTFLTKKDTTMQINSVDKKNNVLKEFNRVLGKKNINRSMLSQFVDRIAKATSK